MSERPRYIMIGGFLGAGKTTSIQAFAEHLDAQGVKVGLITNDQGAGLVDSAIGRSKQFPVEEISGGCFCCKFENGELAWGNAMWASSLCAPSCPHSSVSFRARSPTKTTPMAKQE